ncbi:cation diffusion facilitator family transporter [Moorena sp. SIO3I8]|uniref:cation diffusion facilitator family transporter n=1 Tax=Moorena sp. SIO3I8 TaxID=2607833 RepID=UPI0013C264D4|nr:cation diffusion facilitator family transporter [Moorena sp. SIO3I8]NEO10549.1 cation transporter [Moorena sp. SIO3I8]
MLNCNRLGCLCQTSVSLGKVQRLKRVIVLITIFALLEMVVGFVSHSLTLKADSAHMLADIVAMSIALLAAWLAQGSSKSRKQMSNQPIEVLAGLINSIGLVAMSVWIGREAIAHLQGTPEEVLSLPMLVTALIGVVINSINLYWLGENTEQDLNLRGAFLHVLADVVGSIGTIIAALAVGIFNWPQADAIISFSVAILIGLSNLPLLGQTLQLTRTRAIEKPPHELGWLELGKTDLVSLIKLKED